MRFVFASAIAIGITCIVQGCSGSSNDETPVAPEAGAPVVAHDAGLRHDASTASSVFPAPHSPPRQLVRLAGPVLQHPVVIPVFFGDDADRAKTEALLKSLPGSDYWKQLQEFGVDDITIGESFVIGDVAPTTYSLADISTKVSALWTRADNPAPTPDGTQIYAVFFPTQTTLLQEDGSEFCLAGGAYHDSKDTAFAYAITPHCSSSFDEFSLSATHELIEASTDPYPLVNPAWAGADPAHIVDRGEVGDLCDYGGKVGAYGGIPMFGTIVERVYSNARAATGHDPCIPDLGVAYFGAAPVAPDDLTISDFILGSRPAKGAHIAVGQTETIDLQLYSDQPYAPWQVEVRATDLATYDTSRNLTFDLDRTSGVNGDTLKLTITRTGASGGGDLLRIYSASKEAIWTDSLYVSE